MNRNILLKSIFALVLMVMLPSLTTAATETITWIHTDHLGSPIAGRNAAGETTWEQAYAPWGEKQAVAGVPQAPAGVGYTGHVYDEQMGLVYAGARWYDPAMGRFLSPDAVRFSIEDASHSNRYSYANNSAHRYFDPDGRDAVEIVYEGYQVNTGFGFNLPLGHAGVLLINNDNGFTKYYEYGRYDPNGKGIIGEKLDKVKGNIRTVPVPNAVIGQDGMPTQESLSRIYKYLSKTAGKGHEAVTKYHEGADFEKMEKYVQGTANNKNRDEYSVPFCNCYDFKNSVIEAGNK